MDPTQSPNPEPLAIRGTLLRSVLLLELHRVAPRPLTVAELVDALVRQGLTVAGRASKVISDTLRCEVAHGRVARPARGSYRLLRLPRTTLWRCRQRVEAARDGRAPAHHLARRGPTCRAEPEREGL